MQRLESSGQQSGEVFMRTRDDVGGDDLAEGSGGALVSIDGGFYRDDVSADDDGHIGGAVLLFADEFDVGGFEPRPGRFQNGGQT
jgi:hypothetical protein